MCVHVCTHAWKNKAHGLTIFQKSEKIMDWDTTLDFSVLELDLLVNSVH